MPKILAVILELVITAGFFCFVLFFFTFLHELGHAMGYQLATGDKEWRIVLGTRKKLFQTKRITVKWIPFSGYMYDPVESKADTRAKRIAMYSGGPLVSLLFTILFFILRSGNLPVIESDILTQDALEGMVDIAFSYSLIQLISTIIPMRYPGSFGPYKGSKSDGLRILEELKGTPRSVLRKLEEKDFVTTHWKGGTTTQFLIFPREADYADRDFLWRISSATVEKPESSFTPLPGYERWITPLTGSLSLQIDGGEEQLLNPYEILSFDGASDTWGRGLCTDFNLMIRQDRAFGQMEVILLDEDFRPLPLLEGARDILLFCPESDCEIQFSEGTISLPAGQALLGENGCGLTLSARTEGPARLLLAQAGPGSLTAECSTRRNI